MYMYICIYIHIYIHNIHGIQAPFLKRWVNIQSKEIRSTLVLNKVFSLCLSLSLHQYADITNELARECKQTKADFAWSRRSAINNKIYRDTRLSSAQPKNPDFLQRGGIGSHRRSAHTLGITFVRARRNLIVSEKERRTKCGQVEKARERGQNTYTYTRGGGERGETEGGEGNISGYYVGSANSRTFSDMTRIVTESQFLTRGVTSARKTERERERERRRRRMIKERFT
jgi:hypothetical protein